MGILYGDRETIDLLRVSNFYKVDYYTEPSTYLYTLSFDYLWWPGDVGDGVPTSIKLTLVYSTRRLTRFRYIMTTDMTDEVVV